MAFSKSTRPERDDPTNNNPFSKASRVLILTLYSLHSHHENRSLWTNIANQVIDSWACTIATATLKPMIKGQILWDIISNIALFCKERALVFPNGDQRR